MRIGVFSDTHWSMGRVYRDVANSLQEYTFEYIDWATWNVENLQAMYNRCDVVIVNLAAIENVLPYANISKTLFISHGSEENRGKILPPNFVYGMTSESIRPLFPSESNIFLTPNGVDPSQFDYIRRDGSINTIGWCGAPHIQSKQVSWGIDISKQTNIQLSIASKVPCEHDVSKWCPLSYDQIREWYSRIDLLLVTSIPEVKYETGPLPAFEAIVSGVPVVGTSVGNFANVPGPKFTNIEEGIEIVNDLKSNPEKMKALAKEQYDYVMANYTYSSFADKWRKAFQYIYSQNEHT